MSFVDNVLFAVVMPSSIMINIVSHEMDVW